MIRRIEWLVPDRLIIVEMYDVLTSEDMDTVIAAIRVMTHDAQRSHGFHIIYDVRQRTAIAPELMKVSNVRHLAQTGPDQNWILIVDPNPNPIMYSVASIIMQITRLHLRVFKNMAKALEFIYQMDRALPPLSREIQAQLCVADAE